MKEDHHEEIDALIELLWINDREEVYNDEEEPEEPTDAIQALTALGKPVISPLIELLNNPRTYAAEYAIRILGDIGDERAIAPLLIVLGEDAMEEVWEEATIALKKFGERAQEPILQYLKQSYEAEDAIGVKDALELLEDLKSQSTFEAAVALLASKNEEIRELVTEWFGKYGDKRAVPHLMQLLDEDLILSRIAMGSLRSLVEVVEYRKLITPYVERRMDKYQRQITRGLRDIQRAYDEEYGSRFLGDDTESLNFVAREDEIMQGVLHMAFWVVNLLEEQVLGAPDEVKAVQKAVEALMQKHWQFEDNYEEELELTRGRIYGIRYTQERTYSRLASHFYELRNDLVPWLRQQKFSVVWRKGQARILFARKGLKTQRKGCIVELTQPTDRRRTQGTVELSLWGDGWAESEIEAFYEAFWERIAAKATEVGGKPLNKTNA